VKRASPLHSASTRIKKEVKKALPRQVLDCIIRVRGHKRRHGYFPNIIRPQTFNEKVLHRILFDRRNLLTQLADKATMRSYVEERLGPQILPRLYHLTSDPKTVPFHELPDEFVVKATHGSGWVEIVRDKSTLDRAALIETCTKWLGQSYYERTREWPYKHIKPRIIVEQFVDDGTGEIPNDYKLFVFAGVVKLIQVDACRFKDHRRRFYSPSWEKLNVLLKYEDIDGTVGRPLHLIEMIAAAEMLGKDLDFIRADFYDTPDGPYLGELTTTPYCGLQRFQPRDFDRQLGTLWKLPPVRLLPLFRDGSVR